MKVLLSVTCLIFVVPSITALCFKFLGDSWLEYDDKMNLTDSVHYKFEFKTSSTDGNIYFARGPYYDFERLYIKDGVLNYFLFNPTRYGNGGTRGIHVEGEGVRGDNTVGPINVADGQWHRVEFLRNTRLAGTNYTSTGLILDGRRNVDSRPRKQIFIAPPFFIGGSPNHDESFDGIIKDFEEVRNHFMFGETSQSMNVKRYTEPPC